MKLSFSTLGCPEFDWSDIYSMAKDFGFHGIEMRGLGDNIFDVTARPFTEENLPQTVARLKRMRLEIPCLTSGCCLKYGEKAEKSHAEIVQYIMLASKLGTPFIRILADLEPQPFDEVDEGCP
jgi:fatty-acyl-CoA synthase